MNIAKGVVFSIIVTTHNRPLQLARALLSIVNQQFKDTQIILCSDEASLDTKLVAAQFLRPHDVFLLLPHLKGPSETRSAGMQYATGQYICFLDDDDSFDANYFSNFLLLDILNKGKLFYCNFKKIFEIFNDEGVQTIDAIENYFFPNRGHLDLLVQNFIPNNTFMVEAAYARQIIFDAHLKSHEDWDYLISLSKLIDFTYVDLNGPNVHVNRNDISRTNLAISKSIGADYLQIYLKWPSNNESVKLARINVLKGMGLEIPFELL